MGNCCRKKRGGAAKPQPQMAEEIAADSVATEHTFLSNVSTTTRPQTEKTVANTESRHGDNPSLNVSQAPSISSQREESKTHSHLIHDPHPEDAPTPTSADKDSDDDNGHPGIIIRSDLEARLVAPSIDDLFHHSDSVAKRNDKASIRSKTQARSLCSTRSSTRRPSRPPSTSSRRASPTRSQRSKTPSRRSTRPSARSQLSKAPSRSKRAK